MTKQVNKRDCVACNEGWFVGDVGEVLDHLCGVHKEEHLKERVAEIKDCFKSIDDYEKTNKLR